MPMERLQQPTPGGQQQLPTAGEMQQELRAGAKQSDAFEKAPCVAMSAMPPATKAASMTPSCTASAAEGQQQQPPLSAEEKQVEDALLKLGILETTVCRYRPFLAALHASFYRTAEDFQGATRAGLAAAGLRNAPGLLDRIERVQGATANATHPKITSASTDNASTPATQEQLDDITEVLKSIPGLADYKTPQAIKELLIKHGYTSKISLRNDNGKLREELAPLGFPSGFITAVMAPAPSAKDADDGIKISYSLCDIMPASPGDLFSWSKWTERPVCDLLANNGRSPSLSAPASASNNSKVTWTSGFLSASSNSGTAPSPSSTTSASPDASLEASPEAPATTPTLHLTSLRHRPSTAARLRAVPSSS